MRWIRGSAIFIVGLVAGMFLMQPAASPQNKASGLRLNHFGLYVKDMNESLNFYTTKMGFREAFRFNGAGGAPIVYLQINSDTFLEMTAADAQHAPGFSHVGLWADDLESTVALLRQNGLKIEDIHVAGTKAGVTNVTDPNGLRLELLAFPPESLQRKAMDAWK